MQIQLFNPDDFVYVTGRGLLHTEALTAVEREYCDAMQACNNVVRACASTRRLAFECAWRHHQVDPALEADADAADTALLALVDQINRLGTALAQQIPWEDLIPSWLRASQLLAHTPAGVRHDS